MEQIEFRFFNAFDGLYAVMYTYSKTGKIQLLVKNIITGKESIKRL